jgi:pilus assembly protein CpaB
LIGSYALADLSIGDYILSAKVSKSPAAENAYLYNLDGSKQAMSITIKSFANGLSGKLQSGDIVSVIAPDYKKQGATVIPPELKYVEVISVTAPSGYDANTGEQKATEDERELPSTVTLLVTPEQGNILASLDADGKTHLSLVYRGDQKNIKDFLDTQTKILDALYPKNSANATTLDGQGE